MHQAVNRKDATEYVAGRFASQLAPHNLKVNFSGPEERDWVEEIGAVLDDVLRTWNEADLTSYTSDQARDGLEGVLSAKLHAGFVDLPASVLTDREFWRFSAAYLYDFIVWRQPSQSLGALHPYFGVASEVLGTECVPHRMFNRANIALAGGGQAEDPYFFAKFGASDVWKSHILRTRNAYAPFVVHELLSDVFAGKLPTDPVRLVAKNLKRVRSNVLFEVLEPFQARSLLDGEEVAPRSAASSLDSVVAES